MTQVENESFVDESIFQGEREYFDEGGQKWMQLERGFNIFALYRLERNALGGKTYIHYMTTRVNPRRQSLRYVHEAVLDAFENFED
jgi:hypothetical protein